MEIDLWQDRGVPVQQDDPRTCPAPLLPAPTATQAANPEDDPPTGCPPTKKMRFVIITV